MTTNTLPLRSPTDLPPTWRERAKGLARYAPTVATAIEELADELAAVLAESDETLLSLEAAGRESGYSADHLGRLVKQGSLRNYGRKHAPKVRRGDLPRKPMPADDGLTEIRRVAMAGQRSRAG